MPKDMKPAILCFTACAAVFCTGCAAVDLTEGYIGDPPKCAVHHVEMHRERIQVAGESIYVREYCETAQRDFPNHGGQRYNFETDDTPWERDVIDWVCPQCHEAYLAYWKTHAPLQARPPDESPRP